MIKNTKKKGSKNERRSMKIYEALGYSCTKSGASLGIFDLVCIGPTDFVLVQTKSNQWPGTLEMEQIKLFKCPPNCRKIIHRWKDYQRLPDMKEV
jgi:hypothetical protein